MANVLLADDDEIQRYLLLNALQRMQHVVRVAEDAEQAYDMFHQTKPELVITDIEMPHRNGLWFTSERLISIL